jgi:hypothetical protein
LEPSQLVPDQDEHKHELPDKSCGEEDQQRFGQWFIAFDMVAEPGRNDPRENPIGTAAAAHTPRI